MNGKALRVSPKKKSATFYNSIPLKTPGPGTVKISFDYKLTAKSKFNLILNYNLPGKGNGSAGCSKLTIPAAEKWTRYTKFFTVPAKVNALQYVFGVTGQAAELLMDNYEIAYTPDTITVPFSSNINFNAPAADKAWKPDKLQYGFYSFGKDAITPAAMQIAADKDGIGFIFRNVTDPAKLKTNHTAHDAALWDDDANEIILFDEKQQTGWQFIVSANGTAMDAKLVQQVPGDPWRPVLKWNGKWLRTAKVTKNGFETRFFIPWKLLNIDPKQGAELKFNAYGDFQSVNEFPSWQVYRGTRHDVGKFGSIVIKDNRLTFSRARVTETLTYAIKRPTSNT